MVVVDSRSQSHCIGCSVCVFYSNKNPFTFPPRRVRHSRTPANQPNVNNDSNSKSKKISDGSAFELEAQLWAAAEKIRDFILANLPFNMSDWGDENLRQEMRWKFGMLSRLSALLSDELRVKEAYA